MNTEEFLTFSEAAALLPRRGGRKIHTSTLWRWARKGVQGVRLKTWRLGGRFFTTEKALMQFAEELAEVPPRTDRERISRQPIRRQRTERQRRLAIERAERELDEAGF